MGNALCYPIWYYARDARSLYTTTKMNNLVTYWKVHCAFGMGHGELQPVDIRPGEVLYLPSNVPHKAEALEDAISLDIFSPPRQDWIDGTDDYIKKQG